MIKKYRIISTLFIAIMVVFWGGVNSFANNQNIEVLINTRPLYNANPIIDNGSVMIYYKSMYDYFNGSVSWNSNTKTVSGSKSYYSYSKNKNAVMTSNIKIGSSVGYINGNAIKLNHPAMIYNGKVYVPVRFAAQALGANATWIAKTKTVSIVTGEILLD